MGLLIEHDSIAQIHDYTNIRYKYFLQRVSRLQVAKVRMKKKTHVRCVCIKRNRSVSRVAKEIIHEDRRF